VALACSCSPASNQVTTADHEPGSHSIRAEVVNPFDEDPIDHLVFDGLGAQAQAQSQFIDG